MRDDSGWARVELLARQLGERVDDVWSRGVQESVLDPAAVAEADELRAVVLRTPDGTPDGPLYVLDRSAVTLVAALHYARALILGPDTAEGGPEAQLTLTLYALVGRFTPDEVPEELRESAATLDMPAAEDLETAAARALELFARWQTAGDEDALEEALAQWRELEAVLPEFWPGRAMMLSNLCSGLRYRYMVRGAEADLEESVARGREAVRLATDDDPSRGMYLANLSGSLSVRYGLRQEPADLDLAIDTGREAVRAAPEPQALYHSNAGAALLMRFQRNAALADLDEAIETFRQAVEHAAPEDPQRPMYLSNLGRALERRYERFGEEADLDAAVTAARRAVADSPPDHPARHGHLSGLSNILRSQAERSGAAADLDEAVDTARLALAAAPDTSPDRPVATEALSQALRVRFQHARQRPDIDEAVALLQDTATDDHSVPPQHFYNLSRALLARFDATDDIPDLDAAITAGRRGTEATQPDNPELGMSLSLLGEALSARSVRTGSQDDTDEAVDVLRRAADHLSDLGFQPAARAKCLSELGKACIRRFRTTLSPADLDEAITAFQQAIEADPDHPQRTIDESHLGGALMQRHARTADPDDLAEALIQHRRAADRLTDETDPHAGQILFNLGRALQAAYQQNDDLTLLDEAVRHLETALRTRHRSTAHHAKLLSDLGAALRVRAERLGDRTDLDRAVDLSEQAIDALPTEHPRRAVYLTNLCTALIARHTAYGAQQDLTDAVRAGRESVESTTTTDVAHRIVHLANLGIALRRRYEASGALADLDEAIESLRTAVAALPDGHVDGPGHRGSLTLALLARYDRTRTAADLDDAIDAARAAAGVPDDHPHRPACLSNLGLALRRRHERDGRRSDADEAVVRLRDAVRLCPEGHPARPLYLTNLATALLTRTDTDTDAATEAAHVARAALRTIPEDHPQRAACLTTLGAALLGRVAGVEGSGHEGEGEGRPGASTSARGPAPAPAPAPETETETETVPPPSPAPDPFPASTSTPTLILTSGSLLPIQDGSKAGARDRTDAGPRARTGNGADASTRHRTGTDTSATATDNGTEADLRTACEVLRQATTIATAPASVRFNAARGWTAAATALGDWNEALDAYRAAVAELPLPAWHGLDRRDRLDALGKVPGLANDAAAAALNAGHPQEALRLLEQGRGVLLAQSLNTRDDMTDLRERAPRLADRIREIRALLETPAPDPAPASAGTTDPARLSRAQRTAAEQHRELAREMDELIARARELPGLEDFLRLPSPDRLQATAANGPVIVVNTSTLRCDALIVTGTGLRTVPLPGLHLDGDGGLIERTGALLDALSALGGSPAGAWRAQRVLIRTLAWLWDTVAAPVLAALDPAPPGSHLWWCPTGLLALLPLHAAGHYTPTAADETRSLPDRHVCSYTPTLRALTTTTGSTPPPTRLLAVDQSTTPGLPPLPHATEEIRLLTNRVPAPTLLTAPEATRQALLSALPTHTHLHFSGHGTQGASTSAGGALHLHDHDEAGPVTVADISRLRLTAAHLAYLSACETARGAIVLADEAIHLAGALQLAGFAHAVAAQWAVDDVGALRVADAFYTALWDTEGNEALPPAQALHAAVRHLRDHNPDPLWWAAYVHTGP
ncbi:CHAT domain-containing tetratricopeptide repeat protein [Streptomyces dysideae]|uniref:CHAT domain-containing protein n=1 Tax=Streptomyces dysideae TaxID=909626 RepID=A0A101UZP3_9ACTN|nr:CHAT domain-containing tetratricopeptide repeat protein [Streptomyces dysideae]KUO19798.1 hypothetical protein AQJ91_18540 [Streptomyces dysideae]